MKRGDIRRLLGEVKECNERLDSFIEKAEKFEKATPQQTAEKRRKPALSIPLQRIYNYATHLHQVLSKAWTCSLHPSHQACLLLEHRMIRKGRRKKLRTRSGGGDQESDHASFTLFLEDMEHNDTGHSRTAAWHVAEVRVLEEPVLQPRY